MKKRPPSGSLFLFRIPYKYAIINLSKASGKECVTILKKKWFFLFAASLLALWIAWGNTALECTDYVITDDSLPQSFDGFRIAQVSDLHNTSFGKDNAKLLALLQQQDPDIIVITGDIIYSRRTDMEISLQFAKQAAEIAPCYYVPGNHEARIAEYPRFRDALAQLGVIILEDTMVEFKRNEEHINLMGIRDPLFGNKAGSIHKRLSGMMEKSDSYTILLSHQPKLFPTYVRCGIDLVFTGHSHGGQFRLPYIGAVWIPDQGFFPEYDAGIFTEGNTTMLISRGLGNSVFPFRINNRPEVVLAELRTER